jgi:hypothetical protein
MEFGFLQLIALPKKRTAEPYVNRVTQTTMRRKDAEVSYNQTSTTVPSIQYPSSRRSPESATSDLELLYALSPQHLVSLLSPKQILDWQQRIAEKHELCEWIAPLIRWAARVGLLEPRLTQTMDDIVQTIDETTKILSIRDPLRLVEQCRQWELCINTLAEFFATGSDSRMIEWMCTNVYGLPTSMWPALAEALVENRLHGWKDWRQAMSPYAWLLRATEIIHRMHKPISMDEEPRMLSLDTRSPTGDPYAAVLPDLTADLAVSEIHASVLS